MNYKGVFLGMLTICVFTGGVCSPELVMSQTFSAEKIQFNKAENTLSANLINADISDVAEILAEKTGINIMLDPAMNQNITVQFKNIVLEEAVRRLFGSSNNALFFNKIIKNGIAEYQLASVKIFADGQFASTNYKAFIPNQKNIQKPAKKMTHKKYAAQRLEYIRRKALMETQSLQLKIARLNLELTRKLSAKERAKRFKELSEAKQNLSQVKKAFDKNITREESNFQMLAGTSAMSEGQRKYWERARISRQQKANALAGDGN